MYRLENIKIRENLTENQIVEKACKQYNIDMQNVEEYKIYKSSVDARKKDDIHFVYTIDVKLKKASKKLKKVEYNNQSLLIKNKNELKYRPVVIGSGPAGLFSALTLAYNGYKPILIEQGKCVEERTKDVEDFLLNRKLNINSNVQFGEGGAGTFSDGKLTSGISSPYCKNVLEEFVKYGAPKQILHMNKPHIGTDNLVKIVSNIRKKIIDLGGTVLFETKFVDFNVENKKIVSIVCKILKNSSAKNKNATAEEKNAFKQIYNLNDEQSKYFENNVKMFDNSRFCLNVGNLCLAIGHSARDTFEMLYKNKIEMEKKNFSVGVRIEHKQEMINKAQYGENYSDENVNDKDKLKLPPAEYKLAYHGKERSCYTFCMCPGGEVIASSSEEKSIVTNGMSKFARDGKNANSAVLVNIMPSDFEGKSPLEGIYFQKELEEKAFILGGSNYNAPVQRFEDFCLNKKTEKLGKVTPTYKPGITFSNLNEILPEFVATTLKEGILDFDKKIHGFADKDAILTGVETRSSSPVTILRDSKTLNSNIKGIYPCGEGAGYAGGITSAAVDGIKCAMRIIVKE
jgi:hypothetical protein